MGVAGANAVPWERSKAGVKAMYYDLAFSTSEHRSKPTVARRRDKDEFYIQSGSGAEYIPSR